MSLTITEVQASAEDHNINLDVQVDGMTITVKAGSFRVCGVDYQLAEDQEFEVTADAAELTGIEGWLVVDKASGLPVVFVEERVSSERGYMFPDSGPYKLLEGIFFAQIPPGTTDLKDVEIRVRRLVNPPPVSRFTLPL